MIPTSRLQKRSQLLQAVRSFFISRDYIEIDTPIRLPHPLPEAHIMPVAAGGSFLHSSPEQCMKRLLSRGSRKIFQICHCFRSEEQGRLHQEEFTMLEWYKSGWDYGDLMDECEEFVQSLAGSVAGLAAVKGEKQLMRGKGEIPLGVPWKRTSVTEAFAAHGDMSVQEALEQDMFDEVLVTQIEPQLGWDRPVFLYDYPVQLGSLARTRPDNEHLAERFELYIAGIELANGFSELVDPAEQRKRFEQEMQKAHELGNDYPAMPEKFLADLENMDETAGIALGLDRLFMLLLGCDTVGQVMCMTAEDL